MIPKPAESAGAEGTACTVAAGRFLVVLAIERINTWLPKIGTGAPHPSHVADTPQNQHALRPYGCHDPGWSKYPWRLTSGRIHSHSTTGPLLSTTLLYLSAVGGEHVDAVMSESASSANACAVITGWRPNLGTTNQEGGIPSATHGSGSPNGCPPCLAASPAARRVVLDFESQLLWPACCPLHINQ